ELGDLFELALFELFLAFDAVARPGNGLEALGVDLVSAVHALAEGAFAKAAERALDELEHLALTVALVEEELLGVGVGGTVSDVLRIGDVGLAAILLVARDDLFQVSAALLELFAEFLDLLLIHV